MKFNPQIHTLKSGESVLIRMPNESEALDLIHLKRSYIENTTSIPMTLDEYPIDVERETRLINDYNSSINSLLLVAEYNGELIGNIDLTGSPRSKMSHTAMLGMGIKTAWRNKGLGKILVHNAINWAKSTSALELIWLDVYASNELGLGLYKSTGFKVSGVIKGFFKENNHTVDKIQMYLNIKS